MSAYEDTEFHRRFDAALWRWIARNSRGHASTLIQMAIMGVLIAGTELCLPLITGLIFDTAVETLADGGATETVAGLPRALLLPVLGYFALITIMSIIIWRFIALAGDAATGLGKDFRTRCFDRLQDLQFAFYDERPVGWLIARLASDCNRLSNLIPWLTLDLCWGFCLLGGIAVTMLVLDVRLGLLVLAVVPPLAVASGFFQVRLLRTSREMSRTNSRITASFNESIMGVRTTKSLVREPENLAEFSEITGSMRQWARSNAILSATYLPVVMILSSAGVALALVGGGLGVLDGELTIGTLVAFMQFAALFFMPVEELARRFTDIQSAQSWAERIQTLVDAEVTIDDAPAVRAAIDEHRRAIEAGTAAPGLAEDGGLDRIHRLEFRGVRFAYGDGPTVLEDFDLVVEPGQTIALVGPTGGGKSTIVSLLCRFYEPIGGEILVDGVEYRARSLHWLQSSLGIVQQAPHLFSGTIRENIRYGRLDASDEEIESAARTVNAHDFISALADGYDTEVGEGGSRLSTGQRQLVSLARAVLADPQVFILDEATSSVDTETEQLIQDGIDRVLEDRISFVIAHRLSTIRRADQILVVDGGRVVERGTHDELLERRGRYHELHTHHMQAQRERRIMGGES